MSVERVSSWILFLYSTSVYDASGLGELKAFCVVHGIGTCIIFIVNAIVVYKFRQMFGIGKDQETDN
jgi:hypothetical protein